MLPALLFASAKAWVPDYFQHEGYHHQPPQFVHQIVQDAKLKIVFGKNVQEAIKNSTLTQTTGEPSDECKKCVWGAAKWIVDDTMDKIDDWCDDEKVENDHHKKEFCDLVKAHRKLVEGMVIFWTQPLRVGGAYCYGHGDCGDDDFDMDGKLSSKHDMSHMGFGLDRMVSEVEWSDLSFTLEEFSEKHENKLRGRKLRDVDDDDQDNDHDRPKPCPKCMKKVMKKVMEHVVEKVKEWCKGESKCPVKDCVCKWAREHREEAFGFLIAMAEPWKFAAGYCWPHKHHHDKHHGKHHGKHHDKHHDKHGNQDKVEENGAIFA